MAKKFFIISLLAISLSSCDALFQAAETANDVSQASKKITEDEAVSGLKEALEMGATTGTSFLGKTDGFLKNAAYKVLLPPEVREVESKIRENFISNSIAGPYLDKLVTAMNRGAENAMAEAKPIFVDAIKQMSIKDAIKIVTGGDGAATNYLKTTTSSALHDKFLPVISKALESLNINEPWTKVASGYKSITQKNVTTDLNEYVTERAMDALFTEIKKQEDDIRANPVARTTDMLKKVFDYADRKK